MSVENDCVLSKISLDTRETRPSHVCQNFEIRVRVEFVEAQIALDPEDATRKFLEAHFVSSVLRHRRRQSEPHELAPKLTVLRVERILNPRPELEMTPTNDSSSRNSELINLYQFLLNSSISSSARTSRFIRRTHIFQG